MENIYDKISLMKKVKLETQQAAIENNIVVDGDTISKILASNTSVDLAMPLEALGGECNVSGNIVCNIVYLTEGGEINNQQSVSPFSYKIKDANINSSAKLNVCVSAVNGDVQKVSGNQIKLLTTIDFDGVVICKQDVNYLKDGDSNTYLKQEEKEIVCLDSVFCDKFEEELTANLKGGVKKILMTNVEFAIKDWNVGPNFVSVEGELYTRVLYVDGNDGGELQTFTISKNVKQELEVAGINKDMDIEVFAVCINEKIHTQITEGEQETQVVVGVPIMVCVNSYSKNKILAAVDLYSVKDIVNIQNDEQENYAICKPEYIEDKIEGNVVLSDASPRIDKYIATTNVCGSLSNSYVKDGVVYLEGVVTSNVIYLNDESGEIVAVQIEVPFVLDKKCGFADDAVLEVCFGVTDVDTMVKRGREIYFDAKIKAFINVSQKKCVNLICKAESIGTLPDKTDAIQLYFGKRGESFWDIAKNLKISSEIIRNQNPELSDPLEKDENIALYFQKIRKN